MNLTRNPICRERTYIKPLYNPVGSWLCLIRLNAFKAPPESIYNL